MGRILALLERIDKQQSEMNVKLQEITDGSRQLPQCRDNERRIEEVEKKITQHSFHDINRRLISLEEDWDEHGGSDLRHRIIALEKKWDSLSDNVKWLWRAIVGAVITTAAFAVRALFF